MSKSPKIATKIFKNRQKIASRQAKILSPTGSLIRQLGDKSPFLVTLSAFESVYEAELNLNLNFKYQILNQILNHFLNLNFNPIFL